MTTKIAKSSGNVFADLGLRNPEEHQLKAELVRRIAAMIEKEGLNQTEAARCLQIAQPDVSRMLRGHFRQFSVERLMRFLVALGQDVEIVVRSSPATSGRAKSGRLTVNTGG
jgi:predicted XRE-type DNA-binding protein